MQPKNVSFHLKCIKFKAIKCKYRVLNKILQISETAIWNSKGWNFSQIKISRNCYVYDVIIILFKTYVKLACQDYLMHFFIEHTKKVFGNDKKKP